MRVGVWVAVGVGMLDGAIARVRARTGLGLRVSFRLGLGPWVRVRVVRALVRTGCANRPRRSEQTAGRLPAVAAAAARTPAVHAPRTPTTRRLPHLPQWHRASREEPRMTQVPRWAARVRAAARAAARVRAAAGAAQASRRKRSMAGLG